MITLVNGHVQNASNQAVPNGSISLTLNTQATVIAVPYGQVSSVIPVVFQFDANGDLIGTCQIWSNEELNPQSGSNLGTWYNVIFYDQNGARLTEAALLWQFTQVLNSTVDISEMTATSPSGIYYPTPAYLNTPNIFTNTNTFEAPTFITDGGELNGNFTGSAFLPSVSGVYFVDGVTYSGIASALAVINGTTAKTGIIFTTMNEHFIVNPFAGLSELMDVTIYMACTWTTDVQLLILTSGIVVRGSGRINGGSEILASSIFPASTSVVCVGDNINSYQGTRFEDITIDGGLGVINGSICFEGYGMAENSGLRNVALQNYGGAATSGYGLYLHGSNTTNFILETIVVSPSPYTTTSSVGIYCDGLGGNANALHRCTVVGSVVSGGLQTAGIELVNAELHMTDIHVESCADCVLFGAGSNGLLENLVIGGGTSGLTNAVHITGGGSVTLIHIAASSDTVTNAIKNDNTSLTITAAAVDNEICLYMTGGDAAAGDGEIYYYSGSGGLRTTTPLTIDAATPTGSVTGVAFGDTTGFGNGSSGTAVTTTTKSTGGGPTTPQTVIGYLEINVGGTVAWVPYCH